MKNPAYSPELGANRHYVSSEKAKCWLPHVMTITRTKKKWNTMVGNIGHRLLSAENRKAYPTIWCIPQMCPGTMLRSSDITVQLNLPCSYSNTRIVNLFSDPLYKQTHKLCSTYVIQYSVEAVRMVGEFSWMSNKWCILNSASILCGCMHNEHRTKNLIIIIITIDRLCGLVVRVSGYGYRGLGFDSRRYQIFWVVVGLEHGPLSLVRSIEELLE